MVSPQSPSGPLEAEAEQAPLAAPLVKRPPLYRVLLHNDDYTTRDFVVEILERVFHKPSDEAVRIMLMVHRQGLGVAGVFTREVAETKIHIVEQLAQEHQFPLMLSMEPEASEEG